MVTLIIGGARSGKSRFAQSLGQTADRAVYIATARIEDEEMASRVGRHRRERPPDWLTVEEPLAIAAAVEAHTSAYDYVLVDCLTIWLSNYCWEHRHEPELVIEAGAQSEIERICTIGCSGHIVLVTNEVGCGIVPESPVGRFFRDLQGRINQTAARLACDVFQVVAGIPVAIKQRSVQ